MICKYVLPFCVLPFYSINQNHQTFPFRPSSSLPKPTLAFFLLPIRECPFLPKTIPTPVNSLDSNLVGLHQKNPTFLIIPVGARLQRCLPFSVNYSCWYSDPYELSHLICPVRIELGECKESNPA